MVSANREEGADQHQRQGAPDRRRHGLLPVIAFPGGDSHQPEVLDEESDGDVQAGDGQVVGELDPGDAEGAEDQEVGQVSGPDS